MSDDAIRLEMKELAEAFSQSDPELDFSVASLKRLEQGFRRYVERGSAQAVAAYLGETIARASDRLVTWVSHEAAAQGGVAAPDLAADSRITAVLQAGSSYWFPGLKVEKFQAHGKAESLSAFAVVVLMNGAPSPEPEIPVSDMRREDFDPALRDAVEQFLS